MEDNKKFMTAEVSENGLRLLFASESLAKKRMEQTIFFFVH